MKYKPLIQYAQFRATKSCKDEEDVSSLRNDLEAFEEFGTQLFGHCRNNDDIYYLTTSVNSWVYTCKAKSNYLH